MGIEMTSREKMERQLSGVDVDRVPLMGGWFQGAKNLAALAGLSVEDYLSAPIDNLIKANRTLQVDCMIVPIVVTERDQVRTLHVLDESFRHVEAEHLKRDADAVPDSAASIVASLDLARIERDYREILTKWKTAMGDIVFVPTFWEVVPRFMSYMKYGYEAYFMAIGQYPEAVGRLYWKQAVEARARNTILARLICELNLVPLFFTGEDICNNAGPMCSVVFLREHYFPQEKYALEPLLEGGIRVVRHCDGNVMPIIDDCIGVGYSGFQGFQYECGVDPYAIAAKKSARGERLLFFAGLNVTRTLPLGTVKDVKNEIDYVLDFTEGGKGLFFFTSSSVGGDVPLDNVRFAYDYMASGRYRHEWRPPSNREWPWLVKERDSIAKA
jgi:hypothetical protein